MTTHEDERRLLVSIPSSGGEIKMIFPKKDCTLGNHYHKEKTETFNLLLGKASVKIDDGEFFDLKSNHPLNVIPGMRHEFKLKEGAILSCFCSHPYNPNDDYE